MRIIPKGFKKNPKAFPPAPIPNTLLPRFELVGVGIKEVFFDTPEEAADFKHIYSRHDYTIQRTYQDTTSYSKEGEFPSNRCTDSELARFYDRLKVRFPDPPRQREEMEEPIW